MKKLIIGGVIFLIILISILCLRFLNFGSKSQVMGASILTLDIPKFSSIESECCTYEATFKSFRSAKVLKKELDKIMDSYMKINCNGNDYYYSIQNNVTIIEYQVNPSSIKNTFKIKYEKGNKCFK